MPQLLLVINLASVPRPWYLMSQTEPMSLQRLQMRLVLLPTLTLQITTGIEKQSDETVIEEIWKNERNVNETTATTIPWRKECTKNQMLRWPQAKLEHFDVMSLPETAVIHCRV
jgi:hypothetical protein